MLIRSVLLTAPKGQVRARNIPWNGFFLSYICSKPIRDLKPSSYVTQDTLFPWGTTQMNSFNKVKDVITSTPSQILAFFDNQKATTLQCDASKYGLGAKLMKEGKPIAFASKILTPRYVQYAHIEKEMLTFLFGCKRFHQYLYGRKVMVETVPIFKKTLSTAPPRLQKMFFHLQSYDLDVTYVQGKQIPVAVTLWRNNVSDTFPRLTRDLDAHVHSVLANLPISDRKL